MASKKDQKLMEKVAKKLDEKSYIEKWNAWNIFIIILISGLNIKATIRLISEFYSPQYLCDYIAMTQTFPGLY